MKRRIICFMLTLALLISLVPAQSAFAASEKDNYKVVKNATTSAKKLVETGVTGVNYFDSNKKGTIHFVHAQDGMDGGSYKIQVSTSKKFTKKTTKTYDIGKKNFKADWAKNKNGSTVGHRFTISKLKSKKTYYVRVKSYLDEEYIDPKWSPAVKIKVK